MRVDFYVCSEFSDSVGYHAIARNFNQYGIPPLFFCEISMPVIVPVVAVMAEKISLFHLCRIVMWAIWSAVRVMVVAMVNFIPMMSFWLGWIVMVFGLCFCVVFIVIFFVRAFLSQSVMVYHSFLLYALVEGFASAF